MSSSLAATFHQTRFQITELLQVRELQQMEECHKMVVVLSDFLCSGPEECKLVETEILP